MKITIAKSADSAIEIKTDQGASGITNAIHREIIKIFGDKDYDYFTHSETITEAKHIQRDTMHKFKVLCVEDQEDVKHQLWFNITNCS